MTKKSFEIFGKQLSELQNIAVTITKDSSISVDYSDKIPTACYSQQLNKIILTSNCLPKGIENYPRTHTKLLDALCLHESLHALLTNPLEERYQKFQKQKRYLKLAQYVVNIVEDKRVDYFGILRYRLDLGKRLEFLNCLESESITKTLSEKIHRKEIPLEKQKNQKASLLISAIVNKGLYSARYPKELESLFDKELKSDLSKCLEILENVKYQRVTHDLIKSCETIYSTIEKHIDKSENKGSAENILGSLIPNLLENGFLIVSLTKEQKQELNAIEQKEAKEEQLKEELKKQLENLTKGLGCGSDKGELIKAPEPNFTEYNNLVNKNSNEIYRLLNKLKRTVKPYVQRALFQRKGRLQSGLLAKAYCSSLSREITHIYQSSSLAFEKQKIALEILIDFSGSMEYEDAIDICTILSEVFGNWLEDKAFSVLVFANDYAKIKTFSESYQNTKARIGNIHIDDRSTNISEPLEVSLKMFNAIGEPREKILVIASDFCFSDSEKALEQLKQFEKYNVKLLFVGLCNSYYMSNYLPNSKNVFRATVKNPRDLPEVFIDIYQLATQTIQK